MAVAVLPITDADLDEACAFMAATLKPSHPLARWRAAFRQPWSEAKPDNGFMLREDGRIVGVLGCIYSDRWIAGEMRRVCNLTSWSVLPSHRGKSLLLVGAALKKDGYLFTNLTAMPETVDLFRRLKFGAVAADGWLVANLPGSRSGIVTDPGRLEAGLTSTARRDYLAHRDLAGVYAVGIEDAGTLSLVVFIRGRHRRIPCGVVVHAERPEVLARAFRAFSAAALMDFGFPLSKIERRLVARPARAIAALSAPPLLYRGARLDEAAIDGLYGEITLLAPLT